MHHGIDRLTVRNVLGVALAVSLTRHADIEVLRRLLTAVPEDILSVQADLGQSQTAVYVRKQLLRLGG